MLRLGSNRKILRIHLQRRLLLTGAHPARPRHSRRLRSIEVGDRKALGPRAPGAARHGDDGLRFMKRRSIPAVIARSASDDPSTLAAQATPGLESAEARRAKA